MDISLIVRGTVLVYQSTRYVFEMRRQQLTSHSCVTNSIVFQIKPFLVQEPCWTLSNLIALLVLLIRVVLIGILIVFVFLVTSFQWVTSNRKQPELTGGATLG